MPISSFRNLKSIANALGILKGAQESDENVKNETSSKTYTSREDYWLSELTKSLDGFDTDKYPGFFNELCLGVLEFGAEVDEKNHNISLNSAQNVLLQAKGAITNESAPIESEEKDLRGAKDYLNQYVKDNTKGIHSYFGEIFSRIGDDCSYVVTENDWAKPKAKKKEKGAAKSFAHYPGEGDYPPICIADLLVLFDTTLWGSADDGFVVTGNFIAFKELGSEKEFIYISDIESLKLYGSSKEISFNGLSYHYVHRELDRPMKLVYQALSDYLSQPSLALSKFLDSKSS